MNRIIISLAPAAFALAMLPNSASAQDATSIDYLTALKSCQSVVDANERLACFDRSVAELAVASDAGTVRIVDEEEVRQTKRSLFGFSLPNIKLFGGDNGVEQDELFESTITSARQINRNTWVFRITDGDAVWQINNAPSRLTRIENGDPVVFKRAAMGSYFIRINGQTGVKGRRIE